MGKMPHLQCLELIRRLAPELMDLELLSSVVSRDGAVICLVKSVLCDWIPVPIRTTSSSHLKRFWDL